MAVKTQVDYKLTLKSTYFGLEANTTRGLIVSWSFNGSQAVTEKYTIKWYKRVHRASADSTGQDTYWEEVSSNEVASNEPLSASYHAAQEDTGIRVVVSAIAKTDSNDVKYWNDGTYKFEQIYNFTQLIDTPPMPSLTIEDDKLKITFDELDTSKWSSIDYQLIENHDEVNIFDSANKPIRSTFMTVTSKKVNTDSTYKVRCRGWKGDLHSEWTDYSEPIDSRPKSPVITEINAYTNKSVRLKWRASTKADTYNIEWISELDAKNIQYETLTELFNNSNVNKGSDSVKHEDISTSESEDAKDVVLVYYLSAEDSNLQQGGKYYIRIKASTTKSDDESYGSETNENSLKYFIIGTEPKAPTTWSSVSTAIIGDVGDYINLYWSHNSEDQSILSESILELTISGETVEYSIGNDATEDEYIEVDKYDYEKNSTRVCRLKTSALPIGYDVKWRVRTAGAMIDDNGDPVYGEWSIERTIKIYSEPTFNVHIMSTGDIGLPTIDENYNGQPIYKMSGFPLVTWLEVGETLNHSPISYTINIMPLSEEPYITVDASANGLTVDNKTKIYSKYIIADATDPYNWFQDILPNDVTLYNGNTYQITGSVTMSSGITASVTKYFRVDWEEDFYLPGAEIGIDPDKLTAMIRPYVDLEDDQHDSDVIFSVFRREYDGTYVEIESNINGSYVWVEDPHPALNYARYRIVARSVSTGSVSYHDTSPIPVGEYGVVIQWDEPWQTYDGSETDRIGSMLKLYCNIRKSFSNDVDVSFVNYIGREHPVSYYGTHKGEKMTWSVEIDKTDKETLYAIRRLSIWAGDVYVREPSGVGYWANIKVSYNEDYDSLVVPISFDITRVEGGI